MGFVEKIVDKIKNFDIKPAKPKGLSTLHSEARLFARRGLFSKASIVYRKISLLDPEDDNAISNYLDIAMYDDRNEAYEFSQFFLKRKPKDIRMLFLAAHTVKDDTLARDYFGRIIAIAPDLEAPKYFFNILNDVEITAPPESYVKNLFNGYACHYDNHLEDCLGYRAPDIMINLLRKQHSNKIPFNNVLDACCGTGLFGKKLRVHFKINNLVGVDISEQMLIEAKKKHVYNHLHTSEINSYFKNSNEQYDLISIIDSVNYIGDLTELFSHVHHNLTDGGLFCFTCEISGSKPFYADSRGRFYHSKKYIRTLIDGKFTIMKFKKDSARKESGLDKAYFFVILSKKTISF